MCAGLALVGVSADPLGAADDAGAGAAPGADAAPGAAPSAAAPSAAGACGSSSSIGCLRYRPHAWSSEMHSSRSQKPSNCMRAPLDLHAMHTMHTMQTLHTMPCAQWGRGTVIAMGSGRSVSRGAGHVEDEGVVARGSPPAAAHTTAARSRRESARVQGRVRRGRAVCENPDRWRTSSIVRRASR
jgi:hypothetical protein